MTKHITFASAYRQLSPAEKAFVDDYVAQVEKAAIKSGELIGLALDRPIPAALVEASGGLLERTTVQFAIRERITQIAADTEVSPRRIVKELTNIAFSNIDDYMEICPMSGRPTYNLSRCTPEQMSAVKKIEHKISSLGSEEFRFETYDKLKALEMLSRVFGLLQDENSYVAAIQRMERAANTLIDKSENAGDTYARFIGAT